MPGSSALGILRQQIDRLEDARRRFSRTISIEDSVDQLLPHGGLSAGCIHEVKGSGLANAIVFASILSSRLAGNTGNVIYLAPDRSLHPLGLLPYSVNLDRFFYISIKRKRDLNWAVMEVLRCSQVSSVIAIVDGLNLTESRRLQLAAEASGVTGFLLGAANSEPIASPITRWKISSVKARADQRFDEPVWSVDLLYCRGGRPGNWTLEWRGHALKTMRVPQSAQVNNRALAG
jgi:protein ImuA